MAEFERELVKERTALKRETSRANGAKFGRPRRVDDAVDIATKPVSAAIRVGASSPNPRTGRDGAADGVGSVAPLVR